eukprot:Ihof_evm3s519 gene=Ihof_evmTU3s519
MAEGNQTMSQADLEQLKIFVAQCQHKPSMLHHPQLSFFKEWLLSLGATIPEECPEPDEPADTFPMDETKDEEEEIIESDIDDALDKTGVVEPDNDPPYGMGDVTVEVTEDMMERAVEAKKKGREALSGGQLDEAVKWFTEAINFNPNTAIPFANRAAVFIKMEKPNAAIRDCDVAISHNPDSAKPYKYRGKAYAMLGQWVKAKNDLALSCRLDYDEEANEWLALVQSNAAIVE